MFFYLLVLFVSIPLVELWVILEVNRLIGIGWTVVIVIGTGIVGAALARRQGVKVYAAIRRELENGRMPADKIIEGLLLLAGGFMLLFPGYCTDFVGFMLLVPGNRRIIREVIKKKIRARMIIHPFDEETHGW